MIRLKRLQIDYLIFIAFPIYPLIDYLILGGRFPIMTVISYLSFFIVRCQSVKISILSFMFFVSYIFSILINTLVNGWISEYYLSILLVTGIFLTVSILVRLDSLYNYLLGFNVVYFATNTAVYIVRLISSNMDFFKAKGNISFYGGNTAHLIYMTMFYLAVQSKRKRDSFAFYIIMALNAFLYMSRGAIIIQILITLLIIFKKGVIEYKILKRIYYIIPIISIILYKLGLFEALFEKIDTWKNSLEKGASLIGDRSYIFSESMNLLTNNIVYILCGCGLGKFKYLEQFSWSNPHNMVLDAWFCGGLLGLITFIFMVYKTFENSADNKVLYLLIVIYAVVEGITLFFVEIYSSWIWGGAFLFLVCCYYITKKQKCIKEQSI